MADVAERAGVSVSTVSRTLRGMTTVSPEARGRVEKAARDLSFVASRHASSLVTGKTGAVAVLAPTLRSWLVGSVLTGIGGVLRRAGLDLVIYSISDPAERAAFFDRLPARRNADALLVVSFDLTEGEYARLDGLGMPVVYVSQRAPGRTSVCIDEVAGACRGTQHLLNLGHRRIAFVRCTGTSGFAHRSQERLTGYRKALADAELPADDDLLVATPGGWAGTRKALGSLFGLRCPPTAVFAEADHIALEVIRVLRDGRVRVPEHVSVLGFDDQDLAEWIGLSTVAQPAVEIGQSAAELAAALIDDPGADQGRHIVLPTHLVPRGSTAPVAGGAAAEAGPPRGREAGP